MSKKLADRLTTILLWAVAVFILLLLAVLLYRIMSRGLPMLTWHFLSSQPSAVRRGGGILPELFNSFYVVFLSLLFSLPFGFGAGIYLAEYAKDNWLTRTIRLSVEALSSIPSIVFGLFGLLIFVQWMHLGFTILGGAATLALLNLPVLVRVTEETLRSIPNAFREASLALGATSFQTIWKVLLPVALPGLITGVTLISGRALGETAILIYTSGLSVSRTTPDWSLMASGETLSVHLWFMSSDALVPDAADIAAGSGALLVIIVLVFNLLIGIPSRLLSRRMTRKG